MNFCTLLNVILGLVNFGMHSYIMYAHVPEHTHPISDVYITPFSFVLFSVVLYGIALNSEIITFAMSVGWYIVAQYWIAAAMLAQALLGLYNRIWEDPDTEEPDLSTGRIYRAVRRGPLVRIK